MYHPTYLWARRTTPNTLQLPLVGFLQRGKIFLVAGKYHAIPHLICAKAKVALDSEVLFQVNYTNS